MEFQPKKATNNALTMTDICTIIISQKLPAVQKNLTKQLHTLIIFVQQASHFNYSTQSVAYIF